MAEHADIFFLAPNELQFSTDSYFRKTDPWHLRNPTQGRASYLFFKENSAPFFFGTIATNRTEINSIPDLGGIKFLWFFFFNIKTFSLTNEIWNYIICGTGVTGKRGGSGCSMSWAEKGSRCSLLRISRPELVWFNPNLCDKNIAAK